MKQKERGKGRKGRNLKNTPRNKFLVYCVDVFVSIRWRMSELTACARLTDTSCDVRDINARQRRRVVVACILRS